MSKYRIIQDHWHQELNYKGAESDEIINCEIRSKYGKQTVLVYQFFHPDKKDIGFVEDMSTVEHNPHLYDKVPALTAATVEDIITQWGGKLAIAFKDGVEEFAKNYVENH